MKVNEWSIKPLGEIAQLIMGQSPDSQFYSDEVIGMPFLQGCAEFQSRFPKHVQYCSQIKKQAPAGSILFSVRAPVGKINIADQNYIIGRGLAAILADSVIQEYLEQYLIFEESKFRNASQGSTFESINSSELSGWHVEYPDSKPEQSKIAEILSTVDKAIEQTEALIAKHQHIKTGLMQDLLTKGIDENGNLRSEKTHKFKDSPLGRIPEEWEVKRMDVIAKVSYGISDAIEIMNKVGISTITLPCVDPNGNLDIESSKLAITPKKAVKDRDLLEQGDLLFNWRNGSQKHLGKTAYFDQSGIWTHVGFLLKIRTDKEKCDSRFLWFLINDIKSKGYFLNAKIQVNNTFNSNELNSVELAIPKIVEQYEIRNRLNALEDTKKIIVRQLLKLNSIKTALMQDLLTGKVRVTPLLNNEVQNE